MVVSNGSVKALQSEVITLRQRIAELEQIVASQNQTIAQLETERTNLVTIIDHIPAFICVQSPDHSVRFANRYFREHFGEPAQGENHCPHCKAMIAGPAESCSTCPTFRLFSDPSTPQVWESTPRDGRIYRVYDYAYRDSDGTALVLELGVDITDHKRIEENLRLAQFALDTAPDAIHWLEPDGRQFYVNDALCKSLGYTREELLALSVPDIDPNFPAHSWDAIWQQVKEQVTCTFESVHRRKDGSLINVEVSANYLNRDGREYICSYVRDITARKQAEAEVQRLNSELEQRVAERTSRLAQQTEELRLAQFALDRAADSIFWIGPDARFHYVNDLACTILGYTREELLTMGVPDVDVDCPAPVWPEHWATIRQQDRCSFEGHHRRKDGTILPVEIRANFLEFQDRAYICAFAHDITARKQAEAERTALQQQVIDAQREALRELSTPLIPISDRAVVMPLIGAIDSTRAQLIMETLLNGVADHHAAIAILDITGVQVVDTQVANALVQAARAVKLLGAQVLLTGIQPCIAQTLVQLGVDLGDIITRSTLQAGIAYALTQTSKG